MSDERVQAVPDKGLAKEAFEEAFWRLYAEKPLNKITVAEISQVAGYNRGTFYLHYETLDALVASVEGELLRGIHACVEECMASLEAGADPEEVMGLVLSFYEAHTRELSLLLGSKGDPQFAEALKAEMKPLWAQYVLHRDETQKTTTDLTLEFTLSGALFMLRRWIDNPKGVSPEEMLHLIYHKVIGR